MTPNQADVRVLQRMVDTMVGIPKFSYPARQNGAPKPDGEFAHIRILEEYPVGIPAQKVHAQGSDTTTYRTYSPVRIRARIGVVDSTGIPSSKVLSGWTSEAMKELMISSGYGFIKCDPISNEDSKLEKEWEYRKGFAVELYVTRVFEEVVDNMREITISGEFITDNLKTVLIDINVTT